MVLTAKNETTVSGFPPRDRQHPASGIWFIVIMPEKLPGLHAIDAATPGTDQRLDRQFLLSPFYSQGRTGKLFARFASNSHHPTVYTLDNVKDPIGYLRVFDAISVTIMSDT